MHFKNNFINFFNSIEVAKRFFFTATLIKIAGYLIFVYSGIHFFGAVTDANLYDAIARGIVIQDHPWGGVLKSMNDHGLYSRKYISATIFMLNCAVVPWLILKICVPSGYPELAADWWLLLTVALYPSMMVYSTDVFRDTVMVILFLGFIFSVKYFLSRTPHCQARLRGIWFLLIMFGCFYALYLLRFYLAASLVVAVMMVYIAGCVKSLWWLGFLYLAGAWGLDKLGVFDYLKGVYRLSYAEAGSGYGIDFSQGFFLVNFVKSFFYNVYGFFVYDYLSAIVFICESMPILISSYYILTNRMSIDRFANFLIFFFFIYAGFWVVGVDSLGTAVRYRIFNYLAILIAVHRLYRRGVKATCEAGGEPKLG